MLTDLQKDILIKSAEGIQEGMWCRGAWFTSSVVEGDGASSNWTDTSILQGYLEPGFAVSLHRCAQGEIALRTVMAGGQQSDYDAIDRAVSRTIRDEGSCVLSHEGVHNSAVPNHNDVCMSELDSFAAGQEWARIFREVAES